MVDAKPSLLLHVCCAPCSTHVIQLLKHDFEVTPYFYNTNIHPQEEYERRFKEMMGLAEKIGVKLIQGEYDLERWFKATKGYENEREGGKRCEIGYYLRLEQTAIFASQSGYEYFTTTLSISPHKKAAVINFIGEDLACRYGLNFYSADFKKKDGYKISCQLSKEYGLYRQDYCGCVYSRLY
ncbi:epoxyqueuosine reductase [Candidatus Hakubella thermalkaliphila]|uniref:Epoxyqueuosine reductase QueH n=1 Tax=Candidatus Hakubella thermalkaliphila TaxID=2754717 RepID=A0A6V8NPP0_9ACTN|nr:epoxyqueuosine reductase QueH [Candidatus Hakubella thermalkaliphila]GFP21241.1 epoxyqueuosine reductase [Candidatus Hakubella thermalkaliphila]